MSLEPNSVIPLPDWFDLRRGDFVMFLGIPIITHPDHPPHMFKDGEWIKIDPCSSYGQTMEIMGVWVDEAAKIPDEAIKRINRIPEDFKKEYLGEWRSDHDRDGS